MLLSSGSLQCERTYELERLVIKCTSEFNLSYLDDLTFILLHCKIASHCKKWSLLERQANHATIKLLLEHVPVDEVICTVIVFQRLNNQKLKSVFISFVSNIIPQTMQSTMSQYPKFWPDANGRRNRWPCPHTICDTVSSLPDRFCFNSSLFFF